LPRYARGKPGVIARVHGSFIFPDTNAHGQGEQPHALYSVRFDASTLWGDSAEPRAPVHLDLWERYLQRAAPARSTP
jgi:nitrile hydratase